MKRAIAREELYYGNREYIRQNFFSKCSILLWLLQTYSKRTKLYQDLNKSYPEIPIIRFTNLMQLNTFIESLRPTR